MNETNTEPADSVCRLKENIGLLGHLADFAIVSDSSFVVLTDNNAYLYNAEGEQLRTLGLQGRGKGEYIRPSLVFVTPGHIYLWCSMFLKMLVFDRNGAFVSEYTGFEKAVKKFAVKDDRYVYLYGVGEEDGGGFKEVVQVYDMNERKITDKFSGRGGANEVMFAYANSAGLCVDGGRMLYAHPAELKIYERRPEAEEAVYSVNDPAFGVKSVSDHREVTSAGSQEWMKFLFRSSVVKGVYADRGKIYLCAEIGEFEFDDHLHGMDAGGRKTKIYVFENDMTPVKTVTYDRLPLSVVKIYEGFVYCMDLGAFLAQTENVQSYTLKRMKI